MESLDEDIFALSDDDLMVVNEETNPVEEHLTKQLVDVQSRVERAKCEIKEIENTTKHVLQRLQFRAQFGEDQSSDSDNEWYNMNGEPVLKKQQHRGKERRQILEVESYWKHVVEDKWIIGVVLKNTSTEELHDPRFYVDTKDEIEISGMSTFWILDNTFWHKIEHIPERAETTATVVLDLPDFERKRNHDLFGIISYVVEDKECQTPLQNVSFSSEEAVSESSGLRFSGNMHSSILSIKSVSREKIVGIPIGDSPQKGTRLLQLLRKRNFDEILGDVYFANTAGPLLYSLVEILSIADGKAKLRIYSRSTGQMNLLLRLLRDEFFDMIVEEEDRIAEATLALIEELELYRDDASAVEKRRARLRTDLLIS